MESVRALSKTFHKACLKCSTCGMSLNLKTIESEGGVLYCKVHLPKATATSVADSVDVQRATSAPKRPVKSGMTAPPPSGPRPTRTGGSSGGGSSRFASAGDKCPVCTKTVYPTEAVAALGHKYHKACFRCSECNMSLNLKNFQSRDKILFCKPHLPKESHTAVADDIHTQRAINAPKRTMAQGVRSDLEGGKLVDASNFSENDFQRESHFDPVNQTTESLPGARQEEEPEINTGGSGGWGAPAPAAAEPEPASGGWGTPAPAAAEPEPASGGWGAPAPAAEPEPVAEPAADEWAAEPAAEPAADGWAAEPAAEPAADEWAAEPAADDWGAEPAAEPAADEWGAEPAAEPVADEWAAEADTGSYLYQVQAMYEYVVEEDGELGFPEGAVVNVLEELSEDWWHGEYNGAVGMFPANYVQRI
ncbi:transcription factor lim1, variant [Thecamonas trahens ATCC 50062]|nr:transcription factor lim1, variant [Thecamonas trahens ATCC 50062]KNC46309.1 transcription factor lim1, variant [Thecamonas trahens ATCC 50062]|eukprot:XP_013760602.1 transcription factor lim1, variant [Thecamonas trahens ATCC 50062]